MGAVFAGAARAPITAVIILFELTGEYSVILPLMAAIVLAAGVSHLLSRDTIYTLKLRRRGVDLDEPAAPSVLTTTFVGAVMAPATRAVPIGTGLAAVADLLAAEPTGMLSVVDDKGRYRGVVTARDVADALAEAATDTGVASVLRQADEAGAEDPLDTVLDKLENTPLPALPVLDAADHVVGWLTHQAVLRSLGAVMRRV